MTIKQRPLGIGTLSLPLILLGIIFSFSVSDFCIGDIIIKGIGLKAWSHGDLGTHYTIFYSMVFYVAAFILALKGKTNYGAKVGIIVACTIVGLILILSLINMA